MKLEKKHLAPYFPFNLCVKKRFGRYSETKIEILDADDLKTFEFFKIFKPILRPISDLTKEIEYNREKFIPIEMLIKYSTNDFVGEWLYQFKQGRLFFNEEIPFKIIQKLLEWHFDVFGLIDAGLAIDINTLKN